MKLNDTYLTLCLVVVVLHCVYVTFLFFITETNLFFFFFFNFVCSSVKSCTFASRMIYANLASHHLSLPLTCLRNEGFQDLPMFFKLVSLHSTTKHHNKYLHDIWFLIFVQQVQRQNFYSIWPLLQQGRVQHDICILVELKPFHKSRTNWSMIINSTWKMDVHEELCCNWVEYLSAHNWLSMYVWVCV